MDTFLRLQVQVGEEFSFLVLKVQEWQDILLFVERDNFLLAGLDLGDYLGTTASHAHQNHQVEPHGLNSEFLRWQIRAPFEAI